MKALVSKPIFWFLSSAVMAAMVLTAILLIFLLNPAAVSSLVPDSSKPSVTIIHPADQTLLTSGQLVTLAAYVESPSQLGSVDFFVDGELVQQYEVEPGIQETLVYFPWISSAAGLHQLSVLAHTSGGVPGEEAVLVVGVQPAEHGMEGVVFPDDPASAAGGAGDSGGVPADAEDEAGPAAGDPGSEQGEDAAGDGEENGQDDPVGAAPPDAGAEELLDEVAPQDPAMADDQVPVIVFLQSSIEMRAGENGEDQLEVTVVGVAQDDVGLDRMDMAWMLADENGERAGQAVGNTSVLCAGQRECTIEVMNVDPAEGLWIYQLTAWDTFGQGVTVFERFEVLGGAAEPSAAAEHDDDGWLADWLREQLEAGPGVVDVEAMNPWGELVTSDDLLDILGRAFGGDEDAEADEVVAEGRCVELRAEASPEGNRLTAVITCDLEVEDSQILFPYVEKYVNYVADGGISLFVDDWYDPDRQMLASGTTFSWIDRDSTCGTSYLYGIRVDTATVSDPAIRAFRSVGLLVNVGRVTAEIDSEPCGQGSIADINLRADQVPEGVLVRWEVPPERSWPDNLPDEGVIFTLEHFDALTRAARLVYREIIPLEGLLNGRSFEIVNPQQCGQEAWYTVSAVPADANGSPGTQERLLNQHIRGPDIPCPDQGINSIDLSAESFWSAPNRYGVQLRATIPADFPWPDGDQVRIYLVRKRVGEQGCESLPCLEGEWHVRKSLLVTGDLRSRELDLSMYDQNVHFHRDYVYALALGVGADDSTLSFGPGVQFSTDPSPPRPPRITRLLVSSDSCQAGVNRCVTVEWERYEQPPAGGYYEQAASMVVERIVGALETRSYAVPLDDTSFTDNNPFELEFEAADGSNRRICNYTVTYRLVAYDSSGHWHGASPLTVDLPACDVAIEQIIERRR